MWERAKQAAVGSAIELCGFVICKGREKEPGE